MKNKNNRVAKILVVWFPNRRAGDHGEKTNIWPFAGIW